MKDFRQKVKEFMLERNWLSQPSSDIAKSIIIEAAELLEHFQWINYAAEDVLKNPALKQEIVDELADVFIYATEMAIQLDCDIGEIIHEKLVKAGKKYPVGVVNGKLGSKKYREIKKAYRKAK